MSAVEVIDQIKKLPPEEQEKVFAFVDGARAAEAAPQTEVSFIGRGEARTIRERIFKSNAELLRKLAQ